MTLKTTRTGCFAEIQFLDYPSVRPRKDPTRGTISNLTNRRKGSKSGSDVCSLNVATTPLTSGFMACGWEASTTPLTFLGNGSDMHHNRSVHEPLHWRAKRDPNAYMLSLQSFLRKGVSLGYVGRIQTSRTQRTDCVPEPPVPATRLVQGYLAHKKTHPPMTLP